MFTESVSEDVADAFGRLLGTRLVSMEPLSHAADREAYLAPARDCEDHVFLDPDTGIRLRQTRGKKAPAYVFGSELAAIVRARPGRLTLVFDQALARGSERRQLDRKLASFADQGLHGVAYVSHACFVLLACDGSLAETAFETLRRRSHLPEGRFTMGRPQNKPLQRTGSAGR
jgi:hypothetical protein